jgi:carbon starvation protein
MVIGAPGTAPARLQTQQRAETVPGAPKRSPLLALVTLIPLIWLVAVTFTAGAQKIFHPDPRIGFLAQAKVLKEKIDLVEHSSLVSATAAESAEYQKKLDAAKADYSKNRSLYFNNILDAGVAGAFLILVGTIVCVSVREWILLLSGRKAPTLCETEPAWLPDYALKESGPNLRTAAGAAAIALGLAKELSGETHFERARQQACACACEQNSDQRVFGQVTEEKFNGVRRCC